MIILVHKSRVTIIVYSIPYIYINDFKYIQIKQINFYIKLDNSDI